MHVSFIVGRVGQDPKPVGSNGQRISIATDEWNGQKQERETTWSDCVAFGKTAERIEKYVTKGRMVAVRARYTRRKADDGSGREYHSFLIDHLELLPDGKRQQDSEDQDSADVAGLW